MKIFTETPRLILREVTHDDIKGMFELDSDPEVHRYLGNLPITRIEEAKNIIDYIRLQYEKNGIGRWAVELKETGEFLGWCGMKFIDDIEFDGQKYFHDVGYRFIRRYWGKGYGYESAQACFDYAFDTMKLDKLVGLAEVENIGSNKILSKIGLKFIKEFEFQQTLCNWYEKTKG